MIVVGIDENGYGPKLGPLVATAVAVEVPDPDSARLTGKEILVRDSKAVFSRRLPPPPRRPALRGRVQMERGRRSSCPPAYAKGERTALAILEAAGFRAPSLHALIDRFALLKFEALCERAGPDVARMLREGLEERGLPVWASAERGASLTGSEEFERWRIKGVALAVLPPRTFNQLVPAKGSKAYCDFSLFMDLVIYGPPGDRYVFGKVGGTRRYTPFLAQFRADRLALIPPWEIVSEKAESSIYRFADGREFRFVRDADSQFAPVAMASIVGKYVRELFMLAENRFFGMEGSIPRASGYPGDPKTRDLIRRVRARHPQTAESDWIRRR